ncbi:MAG: AAA family ATPase [Fluviicola sp.]
MKIKNVTINKYKAFKHEETIPIGGFNVFIYGENGSGKSSFYYALKDFFQSSVENIEMSKLRNFNLADGNTDCSIKVEFDDESTRIVSDRTKDTNIPQISDANRLKSFLTYKHLLGVHNVKVTEKIDVLDLVVNGVLKHFRSEPITGSFELGELFKNVVSESKKTIGRKKDFSLARQKRDSVFAKAEQFNKALRMLFEKPEEDETNHNYLAPEVNYFLTKFYPELTIDFKRQLIIVDHQGNIHSGGILLEVKQDGIQIDDAMPHFSLNEAKLSAIAISIFLGAIKRQSAFSINIRPLFLDDILIGLDNENRLKLLDILLETGVSETDKVFKDFQMFITTYDKHWFEIARLNLKGWKFLEFYKSDDGPQIIVDDKTHFEKAEAYFKAFKFPESANFLRKECEKVLFELLPETHTYGRFVNDHLKTPSLESLINHLGMYFKDLGIDPPLDLIKALNNYKSIILNPLSHSDLTSPIYRNDLQLAFNTIKELRSIEFPTRSLLISKGEFFEIKLPTIDYNAIINLSENVYKVEYNGTVSLSPVNFNFSEWTRENIQFAKPKGSPPEAFSPGELLNKILERPMSMEKMLIGLNQTLIDRGQTEIDIEGLKLAISNPSTTLNLILAV